MFRRGRPRLTLGRYVPRLAVFHTLFWLVVLWLFYRVVFCWMNQAERMQAHYVLFFSAWSGFFLGMVIFYSATLQARRTLLVGWLRPSTREWKALDARPTRTLAGSFWAPALAAGVCMAALLGGIFLLVDQLAGHETYSRPLFLVFAAHIPAACVLPLSWLAARRSLARFILARKHPEPLVMPRARYILLHNVLPYALFSSTVGMVVAFCRFLPFYLEGNAVSVIELAWHMSATAFSIALFVVGAARFKTKVDALSPLVLESAGPRELKLRWSFWYAIVIGMGVFFFLWTGFAFAGIEEVGVTTAVVVKLSTCLSTAFLASWWGVASARAELACRDPEEHPYLVWEKKLRESGFFSDKEDA